MSIYTLLRNPPENRHLEVNHHGPAVICYLLPAFSDFPLTLGIHIYAWPRRV